MVWNIITDHVPLPIQAVICWSDKRMADKKVNKTGEHKWKKIKLI